MQSEVDKSYWQTHVDIYQRLLDKEIYPEVRNELVVEAFEQVNRANFVHNDVWQKMWANKNRVFPGSKNLRHNLSQPSLLAKELDFLNPNGKGSFLEIGTGRGYLAALASCCFEYVATVEVDEDVASESTHRLQRLGYDNVEVFHADGMFWLPGSCYQGIIVSAGMKKVPSDLFKMMDERGGRMIVPMGQEYDRMSLVYFERHGDDIKDRVIDEVMYEPMITGDSTVGWTEAEYQDYLKKVEELTIPLGSEKVEEMANLLGVNGEELAQMVYRLYGNVLDKDLLTSKMPQLSQMLVLPLMTYQGDS